MCYLIRAKLKNYLRKMVEAAAPEKRRNSGIPSIKINTGPSGPVVTANNVDDDTEYVETEMNPDGFFAEANDQDISVKVAVRIRPLVARELRDGNRRTCVEAKGDKIRLDNNEFTFDGMFDQDSQQYELYNVCARNLILGCFSGYNATILAYGQTGSGKTHTMGTGSTVGLPIEQIGIVPRVFDFIFEEIENRRRQSEFSEFNVKVQFLELYGDDIRDLLDPASVDPKTGQSSKQLKISEAKNGSISVTGLKAELVVSKQECVSLLNKGIASRMTASTLMNEASSRSHAIFTVTIDQKIVKVTQTADGEATDGEPITSEENISAKFHFVDLAGSERIKKTGATGKTMMEGIQINQGLLSLGNVIAALTDEKKIASGKNFIPYRNSKLTRILQDSLGGNSRTTMICCVSPAESNYEETLSAIKYASRARNIKNKPIVNRDANSMLIEALRNQITHLQAEIVEYQTLLRDNNVPIPDGLKDQITAKAQDAKLQRRESVMSSQTMMGGAATSGELREMKLKFIQSEKENKALKAQIEELKKVGASKVSDRNDIQNERDQLILKNEEMATLLQKNNISAPSATAVAPTMNNKRTQSLIDEYKAKALKSAQESEKKTAELLQKSKKIAELQSAMKRDEQLLKKAIAESEKLKKQLKDFKPQEKVLIQPVAMPGARGSAAANAKMNVPDAEVIKDQFMDKLTSQLENYFTMDSEVEGADAILLKRDSSIPPLDFEGDQVAERSVAEAAKAQSLDEKEKMLNAVRQNVDQIKADLGDLLQNTWSSRIHDIQSQMSKIDKQKKKLVAASTDNAEIKAIEKEHRSKMDALQSQVNDQLRQKKKSEDSLQKKLLQQESRLKAMELEMQKYKKQRDDAEAQKKYGEERFSKYKTNVQQDLSKFKQTVQEKDKANFKLKSEIKKSDALVSQKITELKLLQKKAREEHERRRLEEEKENESGGVDIDVIKTWIHQSTEQLLKQQELNEYLKKQYVQKDEIEDDMLKEGDRLNELIMEKDRLEFEMEANANAAEEGGEFDEAKQLEIEGMLEDVITESDSIMATLEVLEEHMDHTENKIAQIEAEIKSFSMDSIAPLQFKGLNNVETARATLKTFFMVLLDLNVYKKDLENKLIECDEQIIELQSKVSILQETTTMSSHQQMVAMRKQQAMRQIVGQLDGTDFVDNRVTEDMNLSAVEQSQLTKMSLSKIVSNLRNKLKDEEKRNQSISNKLDQVLKEKEHIKQKYQNCQKELKVRSSSASDSFVKPSSSFVSTSGKSVKSRIDTGRSSSERPGDKGEAFTGYQSKSAAKKAAEEKPKKMSFKQRRDLVKQSSNDSAGSENSSRSSLSRTMAKINQNQNLNNQISELENEVKTNLSGGSSKKRQYIIGAQNQQATDQPTKPKAEPDEQYLTSASQPETVVEVPDLEVSDHDDEIIIEESDEVLEQALIGREASLLRSKDEESKHLPSSDLSMLKDSILETERQEDYNWAFEDVVTLAVSQGAEIVDVDSVNERCFVLFSNLKLIEINLQTKMVVQETMISSIDGAEEYMQDQSALAFAMFKELNMIALSTEKGFHMFDYEDGLNHVKTLELENVRQICLVDMYIVLVIEDEDSEEAELLCYMIDSSEPESSLIIKEFMGQKVKIQPADNSVCFSTGTQIGRIQVPEMELLFQEDSGHQILDFAANETCIFTTGTDSSLRLFDSDQGMMLIEPMADMEVDRFAVQGRYVVARCGGGQAMMVFKYADGSEELDEEDFIECEDMFGTSEELGTKFLMKGGLKVKMENDEFNVILTCYQNQEAGLSVKMLKNKSYA